MESPSRVIRAVTAALLVVGVCAGAGDARAADPPEESRSTSPRSRQAGLEGVDALVRVIREKSYAKVGDRVSIAITISALRPVGHTPFHLRFDPAVIRFESADEGPFLATDGSRTAFLANVTSGDDAVVVGLSRLGRAQGIAGDGELCVLHFVAVGPGDAGFAFEAASVRDGQNREIRARFVPAAIAVD